MKLSKCSYACLFALLLTLVGAPAWAQTIYLVRHAEKVDESRDPALSLLGQKRAIDLALHLRDAEIKKIYVSEFQRTQKTAEVLAAQIKVTAQTLPAKDMQKLVAILKSESENVLVVAHSNTLPDILKALGVANVTPVADNEYDRLVLLQLKKKMRHRVCRFYGIECGSIFSQDCSLTSFPRRRESSLSIVRSVNHGMPRTSVAAGFLALWQ